MKGEKKCFGLLLAFFIMVGLSLSVFSTDTNAQMIHYDSIPFAGPIIPTRKTFSDGRYSLDWTHGDYSYAYPNVGFFLNTPLSLSLKHPSSYLIDTNYTSDGSFILTGDIVRSQFSKSYDFYSSVLPSYRPDLWTSVPDSRRFKDLSSFGTNGKLPARNNISGILNCSSFSNGAVCPGLWNANEYVGSQILPYWMSSGGAYTHASATSSDGLVYSHDLSLSDIFDKPITEFSSFGLPLSSYDNFWLDPVNFYRGRDFEFTGSFEFDSDFTFNPDLLSNNGGVFLNYDAFSTSTGEFINEYGRNISCTFSKTQYQNTSGELKSQLIWSCPFSLPDDYAFFIPHVTFSSSDTSCNENCPYFLRTDSDWSFVTTTLITDNDKTPADFSFGSFVPGGGEIPGLAEAQVKADENTHDDVDFFSSLANMFSFGFLNPFAPIFQMFNDNNSCAQIPIIAGMIHSEETEVCPFFDSTTRNIVTPVLGLSSMMLIFGFAVRWLGARSGNFFEDSGSLDSPGTSRVGDTLKSHGWRRKN